MLCFSGAPALSAFRRDRLIKALSSVESSVDDISADYFYLVSAASVSETDREKLFALLDSDGEFHAKQGHGLFVVPRLGTRSPWSSKATDILHNCGLGEIARVERGTRHCV